MVVRVIFFAFIVVAKCGGDGNDSPFDSSLRAERAAASCTRWRFQPNCTLPERPTPLSTTCANSCKWIFGNTYVQCEYALDVNTMARKCQEYLSSNTSNLATTSSTSMSTNHTIATLTTVNQTTEASTTATTTTVHTTTTTTTTTTTSTSNSTTSESTSPGTSISADENGAESTQSTFEKAKYFIFVSVGVLILLLLALCLGIYCKTRKHRKQKTKMEMERFQNLKRLETHLQEISPMQQKSAAPTSAAPTSVIGGETEFGGSSRASTMAASRHNKTEKPISEKPSQASSAQSDVF